MYPALAFDRLFKDEASPADKSVLDAVLADAQDLRRDISASDQRKIDEYLDSVREVEKRIENAGKRGELQGWRPTLDKPNMKRPADGIQQDIGEHMRLMIDLLVLGGGLKGGRVLDYTGKPERQLCRLFMSMLAKMKVRPQTFGDAKVMLEEV